MSVFMDTAANTELQMWKEKLETQKEMDLNDIEQTEEVGSSSWKRATNEGVKVSSEWILVVLPEGGYWQTTCTLQKPGEDRAGQRVQDQKGDGGRQSDLYVM